MTAITLDQTTLHRALASSPFGPGAPLEVHEELLSTNDRLRALAEDGAAEGSLVVALRQTAGRGRLGRVWSSPPGGLYLSLLLRPEDDMLRRLPATLLAGLALAEALDEYAERSEASEGSVEREAARLPRCDLKWPNDVILSGRKVAGILGELSRAAPADKTGHALVLGVGINLATEVALLPEEVRERATSLADHGITPAPEELIAAFVRRFGAHYHTVRDGGGARLLAAASERMPLLGNAVRVRLPDKVLEGTAGGLNAVGGLVVEDAKGERHVVLAGEVEELRPA